AAHIIASRRAGAVHGLGLMARADVLAVEPSGGGGEGRVVASGLKPEVEGIDPGKVTAGAIRDGIQRVAGEAVYPVFRSIPGRGAFPLRFRWQAIAASRRIAQFPCRKIISRRRSLDLAQP